MTELKRTMGLWSSVGCAVGIVVCSGSLVCIGQGFGIAGPGFILTMIVAGIVNLFIVFSFAEMSSLMPRCGGIGNYTEAAMGPFMGIISVISGYMLLNMMSSTAEMGICGIILREAFFPWLPPKAFAITIVIIFVLINIRGVKAYSTMQNILTTVMIGSMVILSVIGLTGMGINDPMPLPEDFNPMGFGVLSLISLAFWMFVSFEFVCPMAEEIKKPKIYIPLAMIIALVIIFISNSLFGFSALKYISPEILQTSAHPHVDAAAAILGKPGFYWISIVSLCATASTINTIIASIPRMVFGLAKAGRFPKIFASLSRWQTPWAAIALQGVGMILCLIIFPIEDTSDIVTLLMAATVCYSLAYILAHIDVIILRRKYPKAERSFRSPLLPIPQIIGIAVMLYMIYNIYPDLDVKLAVYRNAGIIIGGTAIFAACWVKLAMKKKKLFEPTPLAEILSQGQEAEAADHKQ